MPKREKANHSSGMYVHKISVPKIGGGTTRKAFYSHKSKADARRKAEEWKLSQEIVRRTGIVPSDETGEPFDRWARKWLETYKHGTVKEHTYRYTYKSVVEKYLIPYFGKTALPDIRQADLQLYLQEIRKADGSPLSQSTLKKHVLCLEEIFDRAEENKLIYGNPAKHLIIPKSAPKAPERDYWTEAEAEIAREWARNYEPARKSQSGYTGAESILILLETGLRRSELLGLRWEDIRWQQRGIHVQRAVVPTTGEIVIGGTKTERSDRFVPVSEEFLGWLFTLPRAGDYVIPGKEPDEPRSPNGWGKSFKALMRKLSEQTGLPELEPHELRHTFGTVLRERGVDIYTISRVLGHSSVAVTEKIYVHNDITVLRRQMQIGQPVREDKGKKTG